MRRKDLPPAAWCLLASCWAATYLVVSRSVGAGEPAAHGVWQRDGGNARVRIATCGPSVCATNLWIRDIGKGEETGERLVMTAGLLCRHVGWTPAREAPHQG